MFLALLNTLVHVFDLNENLAGVVKNGQPVLLPLSHSTFNAQIEVAIDGEGNFLNSKKLEKGSDAVSKPAPVKFQVFFPHQILYQTSLLQILSYRRNHGMGIF